MDASYVNAFVQGAQRVFAAVCQETPGLGKVFVKPKPYSPSQVSVAVVITGAIEAEAVFSMTEAVGCFIASRMMMGMPVPSLQDEMAKSAVLELSSIISGNVATIFEGKELAIKIQPPVLRFNAAAGDFLLANKVPRIVCVPLLFQDGHEFQVDVLMG